MKKQGKHYTPEEKGRHRIAASAGERAISKLCDEPRQKEFFENGAAVFERKRPNTHSAEEERIAYLEKKIKTKDEVLAELMVEHVATSPVFVAVAQRCAASGAALR